jgi:RHS repeat-associated protein
MSMAVNGRDQGFYDQFMSNESLSNYTAVEGSATWAIANNSLEINVSTNTDRQLLKVNSYETGTSNNLSIGVTVLPTFTTSESNPQQSMCLGLTNSGNTTRFYVEWTGTGTTDQWQLVKWDNTGSSYSVAATNTSVNWQPNWLLTVVEDRLFFTANGILIFNYQDTDLIGSTYTALIGTHNTNSEDAQGLIQFQNLTVLGDIQMGMDYSDGLGRPLQSMSVESSDSVIMTPSVYDSKGRSEASFLSSRIQKGQHSVTNPFVFNNSFITNAYRTDTNNIWDGHAVTGDITNYHTDGYPFSRVINEASPLRRPIQSAIPGADFAIRDSSNPNTHITTYTYEALTTTMGDPGFWYALPTGDPGTVTPPKYLVTTVIDADGKKEVQYSTANDVTVGTINDPDGSNPIKSSQVHDIKGQVIGIIPPNYYEQNTPTQTTPFDPGPTPTPAYASSFKYDFWGRQIETYYPDSGSSKMVYDNAGRPRFTQDANGAVSNDIFNYIKYDILGRDIEEGVYTASTAWNQATIANANDSSWPSTNNTVSNTTLYDVDNTTGANTTTLTTVGRQWQNTTYNNSTDTADITNTYTYRTTGEILTNTQQAAFTSGSPGMGAYTTTNVYNVNGRLLSTSDDTTDVTTTYFVNLLGQTTKVQVTHDPNGTPKTVKTTYTYDQRGNIATMDLFDPTNTSLTTKTYSYLPNNWIAGMNDSFVDQDLSYTTNNCSGSGYYNGSLSHNTVTYPGVTTPTPPPSDYCYTVDQLDRVITANNNGGIDYSWTFDDNSNFVTHTIDSGTPVTRDYTTASNKNQLTSITNDPSFLRNFSYDANGNLTEMTDGATPTPNVLTTLTYNNWNDKARSIEKPQANIESVFDYDPDDLRYRKRIYDTTSGSTLTETILNPGDLEIRFNASGTATQTLTNIAVPGVGLVYRLENNTFYWIMPDHLGSTRMILDEVGTVQDLYNYEVYGSPTKTSVNTSALVYYNLYTGQYYDEELELYNYHARFYDPTIARFLQIDPAHEFYNPYSYVGGIPNLATDPSGMKKWDARSIGSLVAGIVATAVSVGITIASFSAGTPLIAASVAYTGTIVGVSGGFGSAAIFYAGNNAHDFNADAFGAQVGLGTAFGLVGGMTGGGIAASTALSTAQKIVADLAIASLLSGFQGLFTGAATNAANGLTGTDAFEGGGESFGIALGIGAAISVGTLLVGKAVSNLIIQKSNRQAIDNILDDISQNPNNVGHMRITGNGKAAQNTYTTKDGRGVSSVKLVNNGGRKQFGLVDTPKRDFGDTLYVSPKEVNAARYSAAYSKGPDPSLNAIRYDPEVIMARNMYKSMGIKVPRKIGTPQQIRDFHKGLVKMQRKAFSQRKNWMIISKPQNVKRAQVSYV